MADDAEAAVAAVSLWKNVVQRRFNNLIQFLFLFRFDVVFVLFRLNRFAYPCIARAMLLQLTVKSIYSNIFDQEKSFYLVRLHMGKRAFLFN